MPKDVYNQFSNQLLAWHKTLDRPLPWKGTRNPYLIWVSEIILQQTRAAQATPYYLKITERYPEVQSLASAPIDELLSLWQGLGYYSRARNLHHSANVIVNQHKGIFPSNYDDILALKGIGKYTAAAISSFAYDQAYPVIDGNVIRIMSRFFDISEPIDTKDGKHKIEQFVDAIHAPLKKTAKPWQLEPYPPVQQNQKSSKEKREISTFSFLKKKAIF